MTRTSLNCHGLTISGGRPALKDLLDHLGEVSEWETLGIKLGIKKYKLEEISSERKGKMTLCKMDMFDYWLRSNVHASWEKIVIALEQMNNEYNDLAHSLRVKYGLGPSPGEHSLACCMIQSVSLLVHTQELADTLKRSRVHCQQDNYADVVL